ncbi:hypothetical protein THII_1298 [Thioploca ingrica]|uniref:Secreted protein n=1 Tax=Thioploca ingrica TaxID=40754 RepID=A0A090AKM5_9GAMM|nr:hypothetical protein THII_1298 [Thioploca ingrica]
MKKKLLTVTVSALLISIIGLATEASAYIAERNSKNSYKKLDYYLNISCFERVKESVCTLPKPQSYNLNTKKYQEEYHDFYELSQDIF